MKSGVSPGSVFCRPDGAGGPTCKLTHMAIGRGLRLLVAAGGRGPILPTRASAGLPTAGQLACPRANDLRQGDDPD